MKSLYTDQEIASSSMLSLVDALETRGVVLTGEGLPDVTSMRERGHRISWSESCRLLDAAATILSPEELRQVARTTLRTSAYRFRTWLVRTLLTPGDAYRFFIQPRPKNDFSCVSAIVASEPGSIDMFAYLTEGYEPSELFFHTVAGAFESFEDLFGIPGKTTCDIYGTRAHYHLEYDFEYSSTRRWISRTIVTLLSLPNFLFVKKMLDRRTVDLEEELVLRRKIEQSLARSETSARRRIENIRDIVLEFDDKQALVYASPNVKTHLGYTPNELFQRPFVIFPEDQQSIVRGLLAPKDANSSDVYQLNLINSAGNAVWFEIVISHSNLDDEVHHLLVARDIQERRQMDEQLLSLQKLESLGVLAGTVAHDFNNLLVPVLGNVEMLIGDLGSHPAELAKAEQIKVAALKASDLTNQLLIYAGERSVTKTPINLSREITQLMGLIEASVPSKFEFLPAIDPDIFITGDIVQIRQVILNLVTNAAESIATESGHVTLLLKEDGNWALLTVTDTGAGIAASDLAKIFTPFFTTKVAGRGLGLAAVQGIIKSHRGEVRVNSQLNIGTTFVVRLPLAESARVVAKPKADEIGSGRLLVVDDDDQVRSVAVQMLTRSGFSVVSEGDCEAAIKLFENDQQFDAVLLDIMMPKMNGYEIMSVMRNIKPDLRVLFVTGFGTDINFDTTLPNIAILRKPYRITEIVTAVNELINREQDDNQSGSGHQQTTDGAAQP